MPIQLLHDTLQPSNFRLRQSITDAYMALAIHLGLEKVQTRLLTLVELGRPCAEVPAETISDQTHAASRLLGIPTRNTVWLNMM